MALMASDKLWHWGFNALTLLFCTAVEVYQVVVVRLWLGWRW